MVHSFNVVVKNNGNVHVEFMENSAKRRIILEKGTKAQADLYSTSFEDLSIKDTIKQMKKDYFFMVNENNPSIFRPIDRSYLK